MGLHLYPRMRLWHMLYNHTFYVAGFQTISEINKTISNLIVEPPHLSDDIMVADIFWCVKDCIV
jgi:hypothetical protein